MAKPTITEHIQEEDYEAKDPELVVYRELHIDKLPFTDASGKLLMKALREAFDSIKWYDIEEWHLNVKNQDKKPTMAMSLGFSATRAPTTKELAARKLKQVEVDKDKDEFLRLLKKNPHFVNLV